MRVLIDFIRRIPGFFRLYRDWGYDPDAFRFILDQYSQVLCTLTGGRMSKHFYKADDIVRLVEDHWCDECDIRKNYERIMTESRRITADRRNVWTLKARFRPSNMYDTPEGFVQGELCRRLVDAMLEGKLIRFETIDGMGESGYKPETIATIRVVEPENGV